MRIWQDSLKVASCHDTQRYPRPNTFFCTPLSHPDCPHLQYKYMSKDSDGVPIRKMEFESSESYPFSQSLLDVQTKC